VKCLIHPGVTMVESPQTIEEDFFGGNRKIIPASEPFCHKCRMEAEGIIEQDMSETRPPNSPVEC